MSSSLFRKKFFEFALKIIGIYKFLIKHNEYVLSKQILRSGTFIRANIVEINDVISKKEFRAKMSIALKEVETKYWLDLLVESGFLSKKQVENLDNNLLNELISILVKVVKNAK